MQESLEGPDPREVAALIDRHIGDDLRNDAKKGGYSLGELVDQEIKVFLTERHNLLALNFKLRYRIFDLPEERYGFLPEVFLQVSGNCFYNVASAEVSNVEIDETRGKTPTGELVRGIGAINLRTVIGEGRRQIPYTLRSEIKSR